MARGQGQPGTAPGPRRATGGGAGPGPGPIAALRQRGRGARRPGAGLERPAGAPLRDHARTSAPRTPKRAPPDAWRIRRSKYERWLGDPDTFFVIAEADGEPVGYACVTIGLPYAGWATGDRLAELETLSVLADQRGKGIGAALLDAVWKRLAELGVEDMAITTTVTNVDAQRFYERQGFSQRFAVYYGKSPGPPLKPQ